MQIGLTDESSTKATKPPRKPYRSIHITRHEREKKSCDCVRLLCCDDSDKGVLRQEKKGRAIVLPSETGSLWRITAVRIQTLPPAWRLPLSLEEFPFLPKETEWNTQRQTEGEIVIRNRFEFYCFQIIETGEGWFNVKWNEILKKHHFTKRLLSVWFQGNRNITMCSIKQQQLDGKCHIINTKRRTVWFWTAII